MSPMTHNQAHTHSSMLQMIENSERAGFWVSDMCAGWNNAMLCMVPPELFAACCSGSGLDHTLTHTHGNHSQRVTTGQTAVRWQDVNNFTFLASLKQSVMNSLSSKSFIYSLAVCDLD